MIKGARISLRTVREADLGALYELVSDRSLQGDHMPLPLRPEPMFRKEFAETGFLSDSRGRFLVVDDEDRILGTLVYFAVNYMDGYEVGYHLFDLASRGKGVMTEALALLVRYLFATYRINRLQICTAVDNEASRRLALRGGFTLEGSLRGYVFAHGQSRDSLVYSLLRDEVTT